MVVSWTFMKECSISRQPCFMGDDSSLWEYLLETKNIELKISKRVPYVWLKTIVATMNVLPHGPTRSSIEDFSRK